MGFGSTGNMCMCVLTVCLHLANLSSSALLHTPIGYFVRSFISLMAMQYIKHNALE